uniref:Uncharacterized protein n=1 Tax=Haptolina ericina TaxID=156174 RepID=A0A7S3AFJ3_9EUKA
MEEEELSRLLQAGELCFVPDGRPLWPKVWSLSAADHVEEDVYGSGGASLSDGTAVWWLASQQPSSASADAPAGVSGAPDLTPPPPLQLADDALIEWLKFFAGHKPQEQQ